MIRKFFGDGERDFALTAKMIPELERVTGAGVGELFRLLTLNSFSLSHIVETIRLAMIGGGTPAQDAEHLVRNYVATEGNPLIEAYALAIDILDNLMTGTKPAEQDSTNEQP